MSVNDMVKRKMTNKAVAAGLSLAFILTAWIGYRGFTATDPPWAVLTIAVPLCLIYLAALALLLRDGA